MAEELKRRMEEAPMGRAQIVAITVCVLLYALDGFDVLAISFAAPGIAADWGVDRAALGLVLSMELIGMGLGSLLLGAVADRIGRRPTILLSLLVVTAGMLAATRAGSVGALSAIRLATGLGIGGMLACTGAMAAELASARARNVSVAAMAAGYPLGVILGGSVASLLLVTGGWRDIFLFGAIASGAFLPVVWLLLPESIGFLVERRPRDALARVNALLVRFGHAPVAALPPAGEAARAGPGALFGAGLGRTTVLLTLAYFFHMMTFYFLLKWLPKIVVDMGHAPAAAGGVLVWANVGGLIGGLLVSALSWRIDVRALVVGGMLLSAASVALFGQGWPDLPSLSAVAAVAGLFTSAGVVGLYAVIAGAFPTALRAGGTGVVIGLGRAGAALAPVLAGLLFTLDIGLPVVAGLMGLGSLVAAGALAAQGRKG